MALPFIVTPLPCQTLNHSTFVPRYHFPNMPRCSTPSIYNRNSLKIRYQKEKHKQTYRDKNTQIGGLGFSVLDGLRSDKAPKTRTEKTQENNPQSMHTNVEKKSSIALKEESQQDYRDPSPKDSGLEINNDILYVSSEAEVKPSLTGEDILFALQKAYVQKTNEGGRRKAKKKNASRGDGTRRGSLEITPRVLGEVRPITVKPEWGVRIESLEKRLKVLKERADFA